MRLHNLVNLNEQSESLLNPEKHWEWNGDDLGSESEAAVIKYKLYL